MKDSDYVKLNSVNPYLIIDADECIEEENGNKYLTLILNFGIKLKI